MPLFCLVAILPSPMTLPPIILEDDALIAFDKPAGLPVAPDRWERPADTLMDRVHVRMGRGIAAVHRLDAEASGVVLCAKTKPALDFLSGEFQGKKVGKTYLALVVVPEGGLSPAFTVDLPLGDDSAIRGRIRVNRKRGGRTAVTEFRVLEAFGRFAWVECRPLTGSRHQVRVHLASAAAPVVNDALYGDPGRKLLLSELKRRYKGREEERPLIARLALHASELSFLHPATRAPLTVAAPLPHDFEVALKYLRKFSPAG
jgi:RluA family pseudouridine synthase